MRHTWITKALAALLAIAMVFCLSMAAGVDKSAKAAITGTLTITGDTTSPILMSAAGVKNFSVNTVTTDVPSGSIEYVWTGVDSSTGTSATKNITATGSYPITCTAYEKDASGTRTGISVAAPSVTIVVNPDPAPAGPSNASLTVSKTDIAFNETITANASCTMGTGAHTYTLNSNSASLAAQGATSGAYTGPISTSFKGGTTAGGATVSFEVRDANGQTATASKQVTVHALAAQGRNIAIGDTVNLDVTYFEPGGYTLTSSNTSAVVVIGTQVRGVAAGTSVITVRSGNQTQQVNVTVGKTDPVLYFTNPTSSPLLLQVGASFTATVYTNVPNANLTWETTNSGVASVSTNNSTSNAITGVSSSGTAKIRVTVAATNDYNAKTIELPVTVYTNNPSGSLTVNPTNINVAVGGSANFAITNTTGYAATIASLNENVARVSRSSLSGNGDVSVYGVANGSTTVRVTAGAETVYVTVNVNGSASSSLYANPTTVNPTVGSYATFYLTNTTGQTAYISSNNSAYATVSPTYMTGSGTVTVYGVANGSTPITITAGGQNATVTANVGAYNQNLYFSPATVYPAVGSSVTTTLYNNTGRTVYIRTLSGGNFASITPTTIAAGQSANITVNGLGYGTAQFQAYTDNATASATLNVYVGQTGSTRISLSFNPDTYTLGYGSYTMMTIHVDNPVDRYVKISRSNIRGYVTDYNYSHPSSLVYYSTLDANNNAYVYVRPQYSGTVNICVDATNATQVYRTFTVTGYPTMPQTGPNYTAIFVVSGLAVAMLATAVTLNVRKKKQEEAN